MVVNRIEEPGNETERQIRSKVREQVNIDAENDIMKKRKTGKERKNSKIHIILKVKHGNT